MNCDFIFEFILKIMDKFNKTRAKEILEWMSIMINEEFDTNGEMKNMFLQLKDGRKLCMYIFF